MIFDCNNEYPTKVPSNTLYYQNIVEEKTVKDVIEALCHPDPYRVRFPTPRKRVCFFIPNEAGVYTSFFDASLCFPLATDLATVLLYYRLPLRRHTPISIGRIVFFLLLTPHAGFPFSLFVFPYLFRIRVQKLDTWVSSGAKANKKVAIDIPNKVRNWKSNFVFIEVPDSFSLNRLRRDLARIGNKSPSLSEEKECQMKVLLDFLKNQAKYPDLMSNDSLV